MSDQPWLPGIAWRGLDASARPVRRFPALLLPMRCSCASTRHCAASSLQRNLNMPGMPDGHAAVARDDRRSPRRCAGAIICMRLTAGRYQPCPPFPGRSLCFYTAFLRRIAGLAMGTARDGRVGRGALRTPADALDGRVSRARASASLSAVMSASSRIFSA